MRELSYDRQKAYEYAKKWAFGRNPQYYNFDPVGGDCTSFISQCLYAGSGVMNYSKSTGWYYINGNNKSPSWSGVEFLHKFLVRNTSVGPYGKEVEMQELQIGDIAQISFDGIKFEHSIMIVKIEDVNDINRIYSTSHTYDTFEKPIGIYAISKIRFIHIQGVRK